MNATALALRRAGAATLQEFQRREGLAPSGREDALTMQRLEPWLLGAQRYMVQPGDSFYHIARRFGVAVRAIFAANPTIDPMRLFAGQYLTVPLPFSLVPTDVPFTSELLGLCIQGLRLRYPFLTHSVLTKTAGDRPVHLLRLGQGPGAVLYNASHHANEWITTPVLLKFLEDACQALVLGEPLFGHPAAELFRATRLYLVPMVNPDGVDLVTGAIAPGSATYDAAEAITAYFPAIPFPEGWKANLAGVDLNLNYPAQWERARQIKFSQGYDRPSPRDFVGNAPLDQPETAALAALTREIRPRLTLSYHTQGEVIYWKFLNRAPENAEAIGREFSRVSGYALEDTPYASSFAGYKDWFIQDFDRPGFTVEAGLGENPLPISQFPQIYKQNQGILTRGLMVSDDIQL